MNTHNRTRTNVNNGICYVHTHNTHVMCDKEERRWQAEARRQSNMVSALCTSMPAKISVCLKNISVSKYNDDIFFIVFFLFFR